MPKNCTTCRFSIKELYAAWVRVERKKGGPGVDGETLDAFRNRLGRNLAGLEDLLKREEYLPMPLRRARIPKGNGDYRELGIPTVRDRIVFQAVNARLQALLDPVFSPLSFAYRRGKGVNDAIQEVKNFIAEGRSWYVKGDIRGCFDNLDWDLLSAMLRSVIVDSGLRRLLNRAIRVPVEYRGNLYERSRGIPQGSPVSPTLCNLYLHQFDLRMSNLGYEVVRYGDDWLALVYDEQEAVSGFYSAADVLSDLRIEIAEGKSGIGDLSKETIVFLGYGIGAEAVSPSAGSWRFIQEALNRLGKARSSDELTAARARLLHLKAQYGESGPIYEWNEGRSRKKWRLFT